MYFLSTTTSDGVTTIECAISGRHWEFLASSSVARKAAIESALSFQKALIGVLIKDEGLSAGFHTLTEIETCFSRYRDKRTNVQGERKPHRWIP